MQPMIIKKNWKDDQLYCIYSKEKIEIGESYIIAYETYGGETFEKTYKIENKNHIYEM